MPAVLEPLLPLDAGGAGSSMTAILLRLSRGICVARQRPRLIQLVSHCMCPIYMVDAATQADTQILYLIWRLAGFHRCKLQFKRRLTPSQHRTALALHQHCNSLPLPTHCCMLPVLFSR